MIVKMNARIFTTMGQTDIAFITGERDAVPATPVVCSGLQLGSVILLYQALIELGCRTFYKNQLASKDVLSYHSRC